MKVTRVEGPTPITVTIPTTENKENKPILEEPKDDKPVISDTDKARYKEEVRELRKTIASQTAISNELRRMSENLEKQTDTLRQRMAHLLELIG